MRGWALTNAIFLCKKKMTAGTYDKTPIGCCLEKSEDPGLVIRTLARLETQRWNAFCQSLMDHKSLQMYCMLHMFRQFILQILIHRGFFPSATRNARCFGNMFFYACVVVRQSHDSMEKCCSHCWNTGWERLKVRWYGGCCARNAKKWCWRNARWWKRAYILLGFLTTTTMSIGGNAMVMVLKWRIRDEKFFIIL